MDFLIIILVVLGGIGTLILSNKMRQQTATSNKLVAVLTGDLQQYSAALSAAAYASKPADQSIETWAATIFGIIDKESRWGKFLQPPGPGGSGDPTNRWRPLPFRYSTMEQTGRTHWGNSGEILYEVKPPLLSPATARGWGYGLGQLDWETGDDGFSGIHDWIESGAWTDPPQNILKTAQKLAANYAKTHDLTLAIAAYNVGVDAADGRIGQEYATDVWQRKTALGLG